MKNLDLDAKKFNEIKVEMKNAIESGESEGFVAAQTKMAKEIENSILEEAKNVTSEMINSTNDQAIMTQRGLNPLTAEEKEFYNEVITTGGFEGAEKLMPATIFDRVFEDLRKEHPLLSEIDFKNTTGVTEWITRKGSVEAAWWGKLTDAIEKKLEMAFQKEDTGLYKLSAYIPVAKAMLDLGPQWLDRFVREVMFESISLALEMAIINGDGDGKPIGMSRDLEGAVVDGVYPKKTAQSLTDLEPATLGRKVMAPLTKNGARNVSRVIIIANPLDYWERLFDKLIRKDADNNPTYDVVNLPANVKIVKTVAATKGELLVGDPRDYFMGVGSTQKIDYSDHYKFLEDERTYITKQYANGKPIDNDSFLLFNISNMSPAVNTGLDSLSLGSLSLSPSFDAATTDYTASTTDASNNIEAVAASDDATIAIAVDGTSHDNDTAYSWSSGENVVTITVTNESEAEVYTVTVTKS
jgi:HK97 family phage major capsid protein